MDVEAIPTSEPAKRDVIAPLRRRPSLRAALFIAAAALVLIAAGFAVQHFQHESRNPSTDDAYVAGDVTPISVRIGGRIVAVHVAEHQAVKAGQLLVVLDDTDAALGVRQAEAALAVVRARVPQAQAALLAQQSQAAAAVAQAKAAMAASNARVPQAESAVEIADRQFAAQELQARAALQSARARATATESQAAAQFAQVDAARANVTAAQATVARAQVDFTRAQRLLAEGAVSSQQVDVARTTLDGARAQLSAAQSLASAAARQHDAAMAQIPTARQAVQEAQALLDGVRATRPQIAVKRQDVTVAEAQKTERAAGVAIAQSGFDIVRIRRAEVDGARAAVREAEAQLAAAREKLQSTRVLAPADGIASQVRVQIGQSVEANQPLFALVLSRAKWVVVNYKETQIRRIRPGQPATVHVDALGRSFRGRVISVGAAAASTFSLLPPENASGNFVKVVQRIPVRIAIEEVPDETLQVRLSVIAVVHTDEGPSRTKSR
ncbi:MAG: HlyD family secretion protein [Armatimonadetes bacterium]|nr:HlyD family secretion protein [Armatimonadota bacterium]